MKKTTLPVLILTITTTLIGTAPSFAADKKTESKGPSKEQRQQMADVHQKMADCLKSDKPMSECKNEMMKSCHDAMGKDGCPMMGQMHGKMGKGMMHDQQNDDEKTE